MLLGGIFIWCRLIAFGCLLFVGFLLVTAGLVLSATGHA